MKETDIIHNIINGIEPEIAKILYTANPDKVEKLLEIAKNAERGIQNVLSRNGRRAQRDSNDELKSLVYQLTEKFDSLAKERANNSQRKVHFSNPPVMRNQSRSSEGVIRCWNCGNTGHAARFCRFRNERYGRNPHFNRDNSPGARQTNFQNRPANNSFNNNNGNRRDSYNFRRENGQSQSQGRYSNSREFRRERDDSNRNPLLNRQETRSPQRNVVTEIGYNKNNDKGELIFTNLVVENLMIKCLIDTGSMVTLIREEIAKKINKEILPYNGSEVNSATGHRFSIIGEMELNIYLNEFERNRVVVYALVVKDFAFDVLLGNDFNRIAGTTVDCAVLNFRFVLEIMICKMNW
ncbi:hypothetical protein B4U80_12249 [Leptotrombidium deliense]|uniref:CCHC-type domain-containing protein n=1 Tax=Leptotrombidium deliense TaxID=299467 RepID=A0A443RWY4_9ACAR|nr:hypothetical protein B4U80_12249 [Leptotrombidium deliense]